MDTDPSASLSPAQPPEAPSRLETLDVPLNRDLFLRSLIRELAGTLQDVVGLEEASGFVLGNRACPFAEKVIGRPAMCMMTSNVFGAITADNLGYAKVVLEETIAEGAAGCRVVVYLEPTPEAERAQGREYLQGPDVS